MRLFFTYIIRLFAKDLTFIAVSLASQYLRFLQQMAEAMNMDDVASDVGYDMNTDVLVARAHQLSKLEADALVQKTSANYNLHRKVGCVGQDSSKPFTSSASQQRYPGCGFVDAVHK